jgi:hypothetical protein
MAYAEDSEMFSRAITMVSNALVAARETWRDGGASIAGPGLDPVEALALARANDNNVADVRNLRARGRAILLPIFSRIARTLSMPWSSGGTITDLEEFFRAWRRHQTLIGEHVAPRGIIVGANPPAGTLRRLTVNYEDQQIATGRHNQIVKARVTQRASVSQLTARLGGESGPLDVLDYLAGTNANFADLRMVTAGNDGGLLNNATLRGNPIQTEGAAVTQVSGWNLSDETGSPTHVATLTQLWDGLPFVHAIGGASATRRFEQAIAGSVLNNAYIPVLPFIVARIEAGWEGTLTLRWGGKTQAFTEADLSSSEWRVLHADADKDLYPINFDTTNPVWRLDVATGAGASTNRLLLAAIGVAPAVSFQEWFYWWLRGNNDDYPVGTEFPWSDGVSPSGVIQDALGFLYDDDGIGGYLNSTGTSELQPITAAPDMDLIDFDGVSALASAGTSDVGSAAAGVAVTLEYRVENAGPGVLNVGTPVLTPADIVSKGGAAVLTSLPSLTVAPGASTTFMIELTHPAPGETGTCGVSIATNDPVNNPYTFTISATGT